MDCERKEEEKDATAPLIPVSSGRYMNVTEHEDKFGHIERDRGEQDWTSSPEPDTDGEHCLNPMIQLLHQHSSSLRDAPAEETPVTFTPDPVLPPSPTCSSSQPFSVGPSTPSSSSFLPLDVGPLNQTRGRRCILQPSPSLSPSVSSISPSSPPSLSSSPPSPSSCLHSVSCTRTYNRIWLQPPSLVPPATRSLAEEEEEEGPEDQVPHYLKDQEVGIDHHHLPLFLSSHHLPPPPPSPHSVELYHPLQHHHSCHQHHHHLGNENGGTIFPDLHSNLNSHRMGTFVGQLSLPSSTNLPGPPSRSPSPNHLFKVASHPIPVSSIISMKKSRHRRDHSTVSAACVDSILYSSPPPPPPVIPSNHGTSPDALQGPNSGIPFKKGHKRTKSAGNPREVNPLVVASCSAYFAIQPAAAYRSLQHGLLHLEDSRDKHAHHLIQDYEKSSSMRIHNPLRVNPMVSFESETDTSSNQTDKGSSCSEMVASSCGGHKRSASIQMFVLLCCILVTLNQALSSGYFNSVITTIEKRFDIPSQLTGAIVSCFEIGNLFTVIFVSYFGTNAHIPQWIGKGVIVTGIGSLVFALAHFSHPNSNYLNLNAITSSHSSSLDNNVCLIPDMTESPSHLIHNPGALGCNESDSYKPTHLIIFILGMVLIGCGGTPIFTLGTIYIDDHVKQEESSMYIGCMYSMVAFGLVVGFLLGGYFITMHENSFGTGLIPDALYPSHPKWIGAWWVGFILLGILLILISLPFFAFPSKLKGSKRLKELEEKKKNPKAGAMKEYGRNIYDIPRCMWNLITNPVYIVTCLGSALELSICSGFIVFLPKYLETQFTIGKSEANLFAGGIAVPGACIGIFLGGYLLTKFQLGMKGAIQFVLFFNLVCMGLYTGLYFLGCDNMKMAGTTLPYNNSSTYEMPFHVNLTSECNLGCKCSPNDIEPICGDNGLTYFSACHAGCQAISGPRNAQSYSNCTCIRDDSTHFGDFSKMNGGHTATAGPCHQRCQAMIPFLIILFVVTLVVSITQMPLLMVTLRSVREEERAFALGMQFVIFRIFGYIPSPILFGHVIDSTCLYWKANCIGGKGGFCLIYNIEQFRLRYVGVCSAIKIAAALLFFLDWILINYSSKKQAIKSEQERQNMLTSMTSLDRMVDPTGRLLQLDSNHLDRLDLLEQGPDSDYNSAICDEEEEEEEGINDVVQHHPGFLEMSSPSNPFS